jgi:Xaa-Pro aminopeptidase
MMNVLKGIIAMSYDRYGRLYTRNTKKLGEFRTKMDESWKQLQLMTAKTSRELKYKLAKDVISSVGAYCQVVRMMHNEEEIAKCEEMQEEAQEILQAASGKAGSSFLTYALVESSVGTDSDIYFYSRQPERCAWRARMSSFTHA